VISGSFINDIYTDDYVMHFGARVYDSPAGIDYIYALLSGNGLVDERIDLTYDGEKFIGSYQDGTFVAGEYTLRVVAYDNAGNERIVESIHDVSVGARPVQRSGGGSSGSSGSSLDVCGFGDWNCGSWSVCESGTQSRTCEMVNSCSETKQEAYVPISTQRCILLPAVQEAEEEIVVEEETKEEYSSDAEEDGFFSWITGAVTGSLGAKSLAGVGFLVLILIIGLGLVAFEKRKAKK